MEKKTQHFPAHSPAFHKDVMPGTGVPETCTDASQKGTIMSRREVFTSAAAVAPAIASAGVTIISITACAAPADLDAALIAFAEKVEKSEEAFAKLIKRRNAIEARWFADKSNMDLKAALDAFDENIADPAMHAAGKMLERLAEIPAQSIAGLKIKAKFADESDELAASIIRDIVAL